MLTATEKLDQWAKMSERFDQWGPPLRPTPEDVGMFKNQLREGDRTLLLGVTPELQPMASLAVDHNPKVIELHRANAVLGDWGDLPFESAFDALIGDGCLTVFQGAEWRLFQQVKKALKPNGRLIMRVFISPESKEDLQSVLAEKGRIGFHAFKWRVAQALANPYVPVREIYEVIKPVWDHPTLAVYEHSDWIYYFPKLSELPPWDHIQFGRSYELAERCPVITWDLKAEGAGLSFCNPF
jgi:SAM-dependent methyltransferase